MELNREHFRAMIYYDFKSGLNQEQCLARLSAAFGESCPSRSSVFGWYAEFRRGRQSLKDEARSGRPSTAVTEENVQAVQRLLHEDRRITYVSIEKSLKIGSAAVNKILHEKLGVRKLVSRWVPKLLSNEQKEARVQWCRKKIDNYQNGSSKRIFDIVTGDESWIYQFDPELKTQSAVWVFPNENPPTKIKRSRSVGKKMVASFFSASGHIATITLEDQRTVNSEWYVTKCLPAVFEKIKERRPKAGLRRISLHHDNATAHSAQRTRDFLQKSGVKLLDHPPYSPDLAPCDFFLFPETKKKIRGRTFSTSEEAVAEFVTELEAMPKEAYREAFSKWFQRMNKCIECFSL